MSNMAKITNFIALTVSAFALIICLLTYPFDGNGKMEKLESEKEEMKVSIQELNKKIAVLEETKKEQEKELSEIKEQYGIIFDQEEISKAEEAKKEAEKAAALAAEQKEKEAEEAAKALEKELAIDKEDPTKAVVTTNALNFRGEASINSTVKRILVNGDKLTILGEKKETEGYTWIKVKDATGETGWVASNYTQSN